MQYELTELHQTLHLLHEICIGVIFRLFVLLWSVWGLVLVLVRLVVSCKY